MKIAESSVAMTSDRKAVSTEQINVLRNIRMTRDEYLASKSGKSKDTEEKSRPENELEAEAAQVTISSQGQQVFSVFEAKQKANEDMMDEYESALETLKMLLKMLRTLGGSKRAISNLERQIENQSSLIKMGKQSQSHMSFTRAAIGVSSMGAASSGQRGASSQNQTMLSVTQAEHFVAESEYTSFSAAGIAKTADGRELGFGVNVDMSREFMSYTKVNLSAKSVRLCDPLVINVGENVASVSDMTFRFDIDQDGKEEEISALNRNSGFLAYDKNGNGKIDSGYELFGTKSGDGFKDLAGYDKDKNGWIDENDEIFDKLQIWFKDSEGKDILMNLKDADVGAIYLGHATTQHHLNDAETNDTKAVIQSTGIYLKESGGVGTVQHVDMAV